LPRVTAGNPAAVIVVPVAPFVGSLVTPPGRSTSTTVPTIGEA
jgi:hypothetical protein